MSVCVSECEWERVEVGAEHFDFGCALALATKILRYNLQHSIKNLPSSDDLSGENCC